MPNNFEPTFSEIWERDPTHEDDVDFVTDDLAGFLNAIVDTPAVEARPANIVGMAMGQRLAAVSPITVVIAL